MIIRNNVKSLFCIITVFVVITISAALAGNIIKVGDKAPNITLRDLNDKLIFCKSILERKPILVSFFYTNCIPCRKEIPELQKLYDRYNTKISFFLIATDKEGSDIVKPYIDELHISIPVLIDKFSDTVKDFGITAYPSIIIIDRTGKVKYISIGYKEDTIQNIENIIKEIK